MTLLHALGIELPIVQAPMVGVSSPELAAWSLTPVHSDQLE